MAKHTKNPTGDAGAVLRRFLDASASRDIEAMKGCLTRKSVESGQFHNAPEGVRFEMGEPVEEGELVVIPVEGIPTDPNAPAAAAMTLPCVMVIEEGVWRFDLLQTMDRLFGGSMQQAVEQVASAMSQAVEGVGQALAEGLRSAFGENEGDAEPIPDWNAAPDDYAPEEIYELPEMIALPKTEAAISAAIGSPVEVRVAMKEIMAKVGSDDFALMTNWMDDSLFAGYADIFNAINEYLPLTNRLRAMRIEAADWHDHRMVALDGSDVVFRLHFTNSDGYYSDDWVAGTLPGVLAGLPERIDARAAGRRLLPQKDEPVNPEVYRERTVPRYMRRISSLLGRAIRYEFDWSQSYDEAYTARALSWWGLNRVWGGLARACLDADLHQKLRETLHTVRIGLGSGTYERGARFEDGVFDVVIDQHHGEAASIYECDMAFVLSGGVLRHDAGEAVSESASDAAASVQSQGDEAVTSPAEPEAKPSRRAAAKKPVKKVTRKKKPTPVAKKPAAKKRIAKKAAARKPLVRKRIAKKPAAKKKRR